jgi:hypothetical protein
MAEEIKLVRGDNRPYIKLTLTKSDGTALDVSDADTTVSIHFRSVTAEAVLTTIPVTKLNGGASGEVMFNFPGATLNVDPGYYEGEVEINFDGEKQTLYDRLKFLVREQIA